MMIYQNHPQANASMKFWGSFLN